MGNMLGEIIAIVFIMGNDVTDHSKPKVAVNQLENVNSGNMTMIHKTVSKCPTQAITINAIGGAS